MSTIVKRTVYFTMVNGGRTRVGNAYSKREVAEGWLDFIEKFHRKVATISECTLTWVDGKLDEESLRLLDTKYNMDPPSSPPPGSSEAP